MDEVTGKVGWGGKHEFHGEVGFGPGFENHKMVHPGSMSLRDGRERDANNGSHLTSQLSVPRTLCALTHFVPQQSLSSRGCAGTFLVCVSQTMKGGVACPRSHGW